MAYKWKYFSIHLVNRHDLHFAWEYVREWCVSINNYTLLLEIRAGLHHLEQSFIWLVRRVLKKTNRLNGYRRVRYIGKSHDHLSISEPTSKKWYYRQTSNISRTSVGNTIVDHSDVFGAAPVGAAPTTSSFSTLHLTSMDWGKITARKGEKH